MKSKFQYFSSFYTGFSACTWAATLAAFVNAMGASITIFLSLYLVKKVHLPMGQIGCILSGFGLGIFTGSYFSGHLCSKYNAYMISILTLLLSGILLCLITTTDQFINMFILVTLAGFFHGVFKPANTIIQLQDSIHEDRARVIGLNRVAINLGMGIASFLGGWLASVNYHWVFWFDGITSWCAAIMLLYFYQFHYTKIREIVSVKLVEKIHVNVMSYTILLMIGTLFFLNSIVFMQLIITYPVYINEYYHISSKGIGYLFLLNSILIVLFQVPMMSVLKQSNQIFIAAIGSLAICFSSFILPFDNSIAMAVCACILFTLGEILLFPTINGILINNVKASEQAKYTGYYYAIFSAASIAGPIFGTFLYAKQPALLWYVCGVIGLCCLAGFYWVNNLLSRRAMLVIS